MSRTLHLIYIIVLLLLACPNGTQAQKATHEDNAQVLEHAEEDYRIGRFDRVLDVLGSRMHGFQQSDRQKALRLVALCYLAQDDEAKAEEYARQLVEANNYYAGVDDPIRFQEMVERLRGGRAVTVTTASSVAEGIEEAPVPVTIITAEMIENLGYNKNLSHILAAYVPGMTDVMAEWEENIAMHGAFARDQELILVMENGHRLNNHTYNSCSLDYSLSTEKIDRIEVLRGPASSLYGNVALSAVVNIITKQGADVNGIKAKYGYGTFKTHKADITMGTSFLDADIFAWGSFYQSDGDERSISSDMMEKFLARYYVTPAAGQYAHVERYRDKPCYDIGMTFRFKDFRLSLSRKNSRSIKQFTDSWGIYNYDRYAFYNGIKPGSNRVNNHIHMDYSHQLGSVTLNATAYGDWHDMSYYNASSAEMPDQEALPEEERAFSIGTFGKRDIEEYTLGGNLHASTTYKLGSMTGNLLVGTQFEHFTLSDYQYYSGHDYSIVYEKDLQPDDTYSIKGKENSVSFYVQDKHTFTRHLILNAGLRYDIKHRRLMDKITSWSPRLALIYMPSQNFSTKLTLSRSFVDMAYYYRNEGRVVNENYLPQYLTAIQLSAMGKIPNLHLSYDVNFSYNRFKNLYCNHNSSQKWANEGTFKNLALEASVYYSWRRLTANLNFYWSRVLDATSYYYSETENRVACVPNQTANLNVGWKLIDHGRHQLKLYGNMQYTGETLVQTQDFKGYSEIVKNDYFMDRRVIFDAGVKYTYNKFAQIALECENLLNTDRYVIGPEWNMYPEMLRGRNLMASVAFTF